MLVHMEWSFNFVFVLMISWESQKFGLKNFLSWLNFDSIICLSGSILTRFSTRLARSSNLKITRLDPTRQSMTRLARGSNNFRLDPSLSTSIRMIFLLLTQEIQILDPYIKDIILFSIRKRKLVMVYTLWTKCVPKSGHFWIHISHVLHIQYSSLGLLFLKL